MLQAMRSGAHSQIIKFVLFSLLILGVAGLVLMDVGGYFRGGVASNDVAKIGRESVSIQTFDRTVSQVLRQQALDPQMAYRLGYVHQILMSEMQDRMLRRKARELGIYVSDEQVARQIATLVQPFTDDTTTPQQALDRLLMSQGMSERQFVNTVRQEMTNQILNQALLAGARVTPDPLVRDLYAFNNETRSIEYFHVRFADMKDIPEAADEDLSTFYEASKESYAVPERRTFTLAFIDAEEIEATIGITDDELVAIYEESIAYYEKPEQRVIAQAIVPSQDDALAIHEKASAGTPLEQAVKDVTGSADNFVASQTFEREGLVGEVAEAAFTARSGEIVGPVQTPLGWHVLKVTEIVPPKTTPFDEVKDTLKAERMQTMLADQLFEQANLVDDMIAGGAPLEDAIEEYGLETIAIEGVDPRGMNASNADAFADFSEDRETLLETGFGLMEGEVAPVIELSDGRFAFLRADKVTPKSYRSLDDVRADVLKKWQEREQRLAAASAADEALAALQAGEPFPDVAKKYGTGQKTATVSRSGESEEFGPQVRAKFFEIPVGEATMATSIDGFVIGRVKDVRLPDAAQAPDDALKALEQNLTRQLPSEVLVSLVGKLAGDYKLRINEDLLRRAYGGDAEAEQ